MPRLTVAIAGGGLCGLILALALEKYAPDVDYHIYEAAAELTTAGAGIGIQPRTLYVLRELGLEPALMKIAGNGQQARMSIVYRKSDQQDGVTFCETDSTDEQWTFHRGELQKLFIDHIRHPERIHLRKRLAAYSVGQGSGAQTELRFQDGTTALCDVLVGADGIKSGVRAAMYTHLANVAQQAGRSEEAQALKSCIPAVFSGSSVYRGLIERERLGPDGAQALNQSHLMIYCGRDRSVVAYPISQGRILNAGAIVAHPELEGTEEVRKQFVGYEPEVEAIMENMGSWSKWAINVVKKLPTFVDGPVALIGDAAHGMTPFQGAGAGQGFEDALLLGQLLGQPLVTTSNIPTALNIYDQLRRPIAQQVAALSIQSGRMHCLNYPEVEDARSADGRLPAEALAKIAENIERLKDWRRGTSIERDTQRGVRLLRETLSGTPAFRANL